MNRSTLLLASALAVGVLASARGVAVPLPPKVQASTLAQAPRPWVHQGKAQSFCTSTANSTGLAARLGWSGSLCVGLNNTRLIADGVPVHSLGIFFYGSQAAQIPTANGFLCVSPFHPGLLRIMPPVMANANLQAELELDFGALPAAGAITAGSTWFFQYWFRDPNAGGAASNFSDGLRITFCH